MEWAPDARPVLDIMCLCGRLVALSRTTEAPQTRSTLECRLTFDSRTRVATVHLLFYDEATAQVANVGTSEGQAVQLALTDPDSNEVVPAGAPRFAGDFMLTSQGDEEQIFVQPGGGRPGRDLWVLRLTHSVTAPRRPARSAQASGRAPRRSCR
jgi:hypothetical protein